MSDAFPYPHLSPSSINMYLACPLQFLYYKSGIEVEQDMRYAVTGTAVHAAIQRIYDPSSTCEEYDHDLVIPARYQESMRGFELLKDKLPMKEWDVETTLTHELEGVKILGRMDLISKDRKNIIDWKTGRRTEKDVLQGRIYKWISCKLNSCDPGEVDVTMVYLREGAAVSIPYTSHAAVEKTMLDVIDGIRNNNYTAKKGKNCALCNYRGLCEAWGK